MAWQIYALAPPLSGIAQGRRMLQLAAYMLTIALFVIAIALWWVWRNDRLPADPDTSPSDRGSRVPELRKIPSSRP